MPKPSKLVVDVTSSLCPGMVYVMLSRVQCLDQICILEKFDPEKIVVDADVRTEVARMDKVSVDQNPRGVVGLWESWCEDLLPQLSLAEKTY